MNKYLLTAVLLISCSTVNAANRVMPEADLSYVGTFKAPAGERNGSDWAYRWFSALGFRPGDGTNPAGYLIGGGHNLFPTLAEEIAIPALVTNHSFNINNINAATVTIPFADITGGNQIIGGDGGVKLSDVLYLSQQTGQDSAKYYWAMSYYYDTSGLVAQPRLGWADLDYTNAVGTWTLNTMTRHWDKYLLEIDPTWAATHVGGKILGVGRIRESGSFGPSLYATAPWDDGVPPADNQQITYTKLIEYPDDQHIAEFYSYGGQGGIGNDAVWVTVGGKQAFVALVEATLSSDDGDKFYKSEYTKTTGGYKNYCLNGKAMGRDTTLAVSIDADDTEITLTDASLYPNSGVLWVYPPMEYISYTGKTGNTLTGCTRGVDSTAEAHTAISTAIRFRHEIAHFVDPTNGGPQSFPYAVMLAFYDVNEIAEIAAANGTRESWDIQPYAYLNLDQYYWSSHARAGVTYKDPLVSGLAYDKASNKLYVGEYAASHGGVSIFHVFNLDDIGSTLDTTPPEPISTPSISESGVVSWGASAETSPLYVIEKYYENICGIAEADEYRPISVSMGTSWTDPTYNQGDSYKITVYDKAMNSSSGGVAQPGAQKYKFGTNLINSVTNE